MVDLNDWESATPIENNLQSDWDNAEVISLDIPGEPSVGDLSQAETDIMSKYGRELLQLGGLTGGAIMGTPSGPVGQVAGAGLGYGMGANLADRWDEFLGVVEPQNLQESSVKAAKDVGTGMAYEMGGQSLVAGVVGGVKLTGKALWSVAEKTGIAPFLLKIKDLYPSMSDKAILLKAKELMGKIRSEGGEVIEKTAKETDELLKRTGVKTQPTYAQRTGSTQAAAFEQSASSKDAELMAILKAQDAKIGQEGIANVEGRFAQPGTIEDVVEGVGSVSRALEQNVATATNTVKNKVADMNLGKNVQDSGLDLHSVLTEGKKAGKKFVDDLYSQIPKGVELESNLVGKAVVKTLKDLSNVGGGSTTVPSGIIKQIKNTIKASIKEGRNGKVTFENLQDWSSQIGQEIRDASSGMNPNLKLARRLNMLKQGVDDTMDKMLEHGNADVVQKYKTAKDAFVEYFKKFRAGTVGEVLKPGTLSTGNKVAFSDIPGRFFKAGKMDVADDLIRAVGADDAKSLIEDYASHDLLSRAGTTTGELSAGTAQKWLAANKGVLKKYNLYDKFQGIIKSQTGLDAATETLKGFNKTVASKILNTDVNKIIETIFSGAGKKNGARVARDLLNAPGVKNNKQAIDGIKTAFKDFLFKKMETSKIDAAGNVVTSVAKAKNLISDNLPAMQVLYKDTPKQLKALLDYHKLLEMLTRNKSVTYAGGSTTAEKISSPMGSIFSNAAQLAAVQLHKGWVFSSSKNLAKAIFNAPSKYTSAQVEALLHEALYNPEAAQVIMNATKSPSALKAQKEINHHLLTMGIYTADKLRQ